MSKFVNYKKRSVTLPFGCKNLSDLLKAHGTSEPLGKLHAGAISPDKPPFVVHEESFTGTISDIEKYVTMVFESSTSKILLHVTPPDAQFPLSVFRMGDTIMAGLDVQAGTNQEKAVRSFFAQRGLSVSLDAGIMPPQFHPDLPWRTRFDISPLPSEASILSKFMADLLRDAFGVGDNSPLSFLYGEIKDAA